MNYKIRKYGDDMLKMSECKRNNLCIDCDNTQCMLAGKIISDCPKYNCDNNNQCETCNFIKEFQKEERKRYEKNKKKNNGI